MWRKLLLVGVLVSSAIMASCVGDDPSPTPATPPSNPGSSTSSSTSGAPGTSTSSSTSGAPGTSTSSSSGSPAGAAAFQGTWKTTTATQSQQQCSDAQNNGGVSGGAIIYSVTPGSTSDLVLTNTIAPGCTLKANVSGNVATFVAGNQCQQAVAANAYKQYVYDTTSTFTLSADQKTAQLHISATWHGFLDGAETADSCLFTEDDPLTKE